tara:strand:- start:260 stop:610 length:351 start_codon:yes stop_codon:yes gene_type:complete
MTAMTKGFMPRYFSDTGDDRIIYEEEQEVAEMYFIVKGFIGIGYNYWGGKLTENSFVIAQKQKGRQVLCDHYVVNKRRSNFLYMALQETHCYAIRKKFMHLVVFPGFPDIYSIMQS